MTAELEALERWARGLGYMHKVLAPVPMPVWSVHLGDVVTVMHGTGRSARQWDIGPLAGLLWANAVESGVDGLARLVCEAAPREPFDVVRELTRGVAREALTVAADRLLADGDPLGEWIAAWLRGECPACKGGGWVMVPWSANGLVKRECVACHGHGVLLGAHVDAMIAGLFAV